MVKVALSPSAQTTPDLLPNFHLAGRPSLTAPHPHPVGTDTHFWRRYAVGESTRSVPFFL